jgi:hypothetical protein
MLPKPYSCGKELTLWPKVNVAVVCNMLQLGAEFWGEGTPTFGSEALRFALTLKDLRSILAECW